MKKINKNFISLFVLITLMTPVYVLAWEEYSKETKIYNIEQDYYGQFKREFYEQLLKWDFSQIDKKIAWYKADIQYLLDNPESEYYKNVSIYKEKLQALETLKNNFSQNLDKTNKFIEQKKEDINKSKEILKEQINKKVQENKKEIELFGKKVVSKKQEMINKYKNLFEKQLEKRLSNLSEEKINKILSNIDNSIKKYSSLNISQEKKDNFLSQLQALKEILESKLIETQEMINLDELFEE